MLPNQDSSGGCPNLPALFAGGWAPPGAWAGGAPLRFSLKPHGPEGDPALRCLQGRVRCCRYHGLFAVGFVVPARRKKREGQGTHCMDGASAIKAWATLYNRIGVVKRHVDMRKVLTFLSWKVLLLLLVLLLLFAHATTGSLSESCGGRLVPPTIYPVTDSRP